MKNTLTDLNNHLFAALERLSDEDIAGELLETEINRAGAIGDVAVSIIKNGELLLKASVLAQSYANHKVPKQLAFMVDGDGKGGRE
jgi:hypothetical protein